MFKMDSNCIDHNANQAATSAGVDYKPDTFVERGVFPEGENFLCLVCNQPIWNMLAIPMHIARKGHCSRFELANASCEKVDVYFTCKLCTKYRTANWKAFLYHFYEHKYLTKSKCRTISYKYIIVNQIIEHEDGTFFCCYCQQLIIEQNLIRQHIRSEKHARPQQICDKVTCGEKLKEKYCEILAKNWLYHESLTTFICYLCKTSITGKKSCLAHIYSNIEHMKNIIAKENAPLNNDTTNEDLQDLPPKLSQHETLESLRKRISKKSKKGPSGTSIVPKTKSVLPHVSSDQFRHNMFAITNEGDTASKPQTESKKTADGSSISQESDQEYLKGNVQNIYEVNTETLRTIKLSCQLCFPKTPHIIYCLICDQFVASKLQTFYEHIRSSAHTTYLAETEQNDQYFIDYPDQFSDLTLAKEFMQKGPEERILCYACDASIRNDEVIICEHIKTYFHRRKRQCWVQKMEMTLENILVEMESTCYNIQKYWCQICDMGFNTQSHFGEHMDSKEHRDNLDKIGEFRNRLIYDSCIACARLWLGFPGIYTQHCDGPMHKNRVQSGDFLVCELSNQAIKLLKNAEAKVTDLIQMSDQVLTIQKAESDTLVKCLEDTVKSIIPNAKAYPFGSRVSGLGFPNSDIDIFLDCGTYDGSQNIDQEQLIISVEQCLSANQQSWEIEKTLVNTRTPVIKLRHRDTEMSCDVSFKNGLSVENTKLLKCFIDNYPLCRKLMLFFKKWLSLCNLSGSQYITNYAACWYVIFYLQSKSIVPSVASLIAKENKSKIIDGWETGISETFDVGEQEYTFTELLHGFFYFYTNFDFRNSVACPILGRTVLKHNFTDLVRLPKEMAPYINHVVTKSLLQGRKQKTELFRIDSEMCIQDPYDLSHNLTKGVQDFTLHRFKRLCASSADLLNPFRDRRRITSYGQFNCELNISPVTGTMKRQPRICGSGHTNDIKTRENAGHQFLLKNENTSAKRKNTEPQVNEKKNVQLNVAENLRELELMKGTLKAKIEPDIRRISSVSENKTGLKNPLHKLSIADLNGKNSKELGQNQLNSMDQTPRHMKSRKPDARLNYSRAVDPKYLKVNMQHIYEVNPEKLRTMILSCELCFPKTANMIYCLICERSVASELQTFYEHICSSAHIMYLADAEKNDKHFIDYPDQFSDLTIAKEFMQEAEQETIQCFACDVSMQNDDIVICYHIRGDSHKERKRVWNKQMRKILQNILVVAESTWYNIQKYWCKPCDMEYNTEFHFAEHMDSKKHRYSLKKIGEFQNSLIYDSCITCAMLWLGFSDTYTQHCKQPMHKYLMQSGDFFKCDLPNQAITLVKNAEAEVTSLIELSDQVFTVQKAKSDMLLRCLEDIVKPVFPDAKAYPFGSRVSGLGFPDSDIDVFLDCGTYDGNNTTKNYQERLIKSVEQCLYANQQSWEIERNLVTARTPIIKLRHRDTELRCDISFVNGLSVENTKLLKCFIDNYPLCRKLMLFLKKWLSLCNLSGSQYITNYAACWYVIFYLQSKSIVPSVASLIASRNKSKIIGGWETGISESFDVGEQEYTFTELLHGFFTFYANFDYRDSVACPILGKTILKHDFTELDLLPKEMAPYVNHVVTKNVEGLAELFRIDSEMCIQDPYDLSHNLTKAVRKFTLNRLKRLCVASADLLNNFINYPHATSHSQRCDIF